MPGLSFTLPHWLYWVGLIVFPIVAMVLSRRPGQIREIVEVDKPLAERGYADPDLDAYQKRLWTLMRDEARAADAELIHV